MAAEAETRINHVINTAAFQVFEPENNSRYSLAHLAHNDFYESRIEVGGERAAAVLGIFAVGSCAKLPRLVVDREVVTDDHDFCMAERAIDEGFENLNCIEHPIPRVSKDFSQKVLEDSSLYFNDRNSTRLVAGIYALSRDHGKTYEPWLAYNRKLEDMAFYVRELILRRVENVESEKPNQLARELLNPNANIRASMALAIAQEILPTDPSSFFRSYR